MRFADINRVYTEKVAEWMAKGYGINAGTMGGSQGEIAHIDLTNGHEIVRIVMERESTWGETCSDRIVVRVGKVTDTSIKPNSNDSWQTIWNNKLEIVDETSFYIIDRDNGWYGTLEDAKEMTEKMMSRYQSKNDSEDVTELPRRKEIVLKSIRRMKGFKNARPVDIDKIIRRRTEKGLLYQVRAKGKWFNLYIAR